MHLPRLPTENRIAWIAALALALVAVAVAAVVVVHEITKPRTKDFHNATAPFVTTTAVTTTATTPAVAKKAANKFLWPIYGRNDARTRVFDGPADLKPPFKVGWKLSGNAPVEFPPDIDGNVLYFMDDNASVNKVNARTGHREWRVHVGTLSAASPALDPKHNLLFVPVLSTDSDTPGNGQFVALSMNTGKVVWHDPLPTGSESSPLIWGNNVYFGDQGGTVFDLNALTGKVIWQLQTGGSVKGGPTLSDGVLYFGNYAGQVFAVNAITGKQIWETTITPNIYASPTIANGRLFVGTTAGGFYSLLASNGSIAWSLSTGNYVYSSAAVDETVPGLGPTVYFGSYSGTAYAVNAKTGGVDWTADFGNSISGAASIVDNVVYFSGVYSPNYTKGYDITNGNQVFYFDDGAYTATVASPHAVYLSGHYTLYELLPAH